ncbi:MAG: adenylate/guanylate cyclase domain-containing protein [Verrucomicrobiota bacterium]
MPYRSKLLLAFTALALVSCALVFLVLNHFAGQSNFRQIQATVLSIAVSAANEVDGNIHEKINGPKAQDSPPYQTIESQLRSIRDANRAAGIDVAFIYTVRPVSPGAADWIYVVDAEESGDDKSAFGDPFVFEAENPEDLINDLEKPASSDKAFTHDEYGSWLSANAPIRNTAGISVALLGVDLNADDVRNAARRLRNQGLLALAIALVVAGALATVASSWASRPLSRISKALAAIGQGNLDTRLPATNEDEFGQVEKAVNTMAASLRQQTALQGSLTRYLSRNVTDNLAATSQQPDKILPAGEPQPSAERHITVLFCDLHGFEKLNTVLDPDQIAAVLQTFFSKMITEVFDHGGTVDRSFDSGFMATFGALRDDPNQERHALRAALAMARAGETMSETLASTGAIELGVRIGIHTGNATVADLDAAKRISATAAGPVVDLTARILAESRQRQIDILVSKPAADAVWNDFTFQPAGELTTDQEPIPLFQVPTKTARPHRP